MNKNDKKTLSIFVNIASMRSSLFHVASGRVVSVGSLIMPLLGILPGTIPDPFIGSSSATLFYR